MTQLSGKRRVFVLELRRGPSEWSGTVRKLPEVRLYGHDDVSLINGLQRAVFEHLAKESRDAKAPLVKEVLFEIDRR